MKGFEAKKALGPREAAGLLRFRQGAAEIVREPQDVGPYQVGSGLEEIVLEGVRLKGRRSGLLAGFGQPPLPHEDLGQVQAPFYLFGWSALFDHGPEFGFGAGQVVHGDEDGTARVLDRIARRSRVRSEPIVEG